MIYLEKKFPKKRRGHGSDYPRLPFQMLFILFFFFLAGFWAGQPSAAYGQVQLSTPDIQASISFQQPRTGKMIATVVDDNGEPIQGLTKENFTISEGKKTARIISVEPLLVQKDIGMNIVLVVDNSYSMKERKAIRPLLDALDRFLSNVRPIDVVHLILFNENDTLNVGDQNFRVKVFTSSDRSELKNFLETSFSENITRGTYLYDAMYTGIEMIKKMPPRSNPFMVVFSDGHDINSILEQPDLKKAVKGMEFRAYAVDYMPKPEPDPFLNSFAREKGGRLWKAESAQQLIPIFEAISTTLFQQYLITYEWLAPPTGNVSIEPGMLKIEEITTIDTSPLLNYVFFETGQSQIPERYRLFQGTSEAQSFDENRLKGTMEKYHHLLNIIGKRMLDNPGASVKLIGCNSNRAVERGKIELSRSRADTVAAYLRNTWGIDHSRITIVAKNLPDHPSAPNITEGMMENQRVEIHSDNPAILDTVQTTYVTKTSSAKAIEVFPKIEAEAGIESWKLILRGNDGTVLVGFGGNGKPEKSYTWQPNDSELEKLAHLKQVSAVLEVVDQQGEALSKDSAATMDIDFIQKQELIARKMGYRVVEKYALILFDFDSDKIKGRNETIVNRITERIQKIPFPMVRVDGHTDTIGSEDYNLKLSTRRAKSVYEQIVAQTGVFPDITYYGLGETQPIYDNELPEGRQLNRTVTVTIEYIEKNE